VPAHFLLLLLGSVITKRRHLALAAVGPDSLSYIAYNHAAAAQQAHDRSSRAVAHFTIARPRTRQPAGAYDRPPSFAAAPSSASRQTLAVQCAQTANVRHRCCSALHITCPL
jgi:hypothetical protein